MTDSPLPPEVFELRIPSHRPRVVVDVDLEKFFDRVNHDILMSRVARQVEDERVLKLIRRYLEAWMMSEGIVSERTEGTPQNRTGLPHEI